MYLSRLFAVLALSLSASAQGLVISEFLASNDDGIVDVDGDSSDWIEIHNPTSNTINLSNWHLTDDPADPFKWTLPGLNFPPGGYMVIFASAKDRTNPLDELHTNFKLNVDGEYLAITNPSGVVLTTEFAPTFPQQFEDVSYGFEFAPNLTTNEYYFHTPTPGAVNTSPGPLIAEVIHTPDQPSDGDEIVVTAEVFGELGSSGIVQLEYRVMYQSSNSVSMLDDGSSPDAVAGDGIYSGSIPASASASGEMVRWSVFALDVNFNGVREPPYLDPLGDPEFFGTVISDPSVVTPQRVFHWFVQNPNFANSTSGTQCSLWFEGMFYDNIHVNARGNTSLGYPKKSYKLDFNNGDRFFLEESGRKVDEINLNTTWADKAFIRQPLSYDLYAACGAAGSLCYLARLQQNGDFFSVCAFTEEPDEDLLEHYGLDGDGALYKMYNMCTSGTSGVEKVTRLHESNSDLQQFVIGVQYGNSDRRKNVFDTVDIPAVISYLAATAILFDNDHVHKNYFLYRDSDGDEEWRFIPWDKDLTLGRNYTTGGGVLNDTMFATQDPLCHPLFGDRFHPKIDGPWNRLIDAMYSQPDIVEMYGRRLRTLMDQFLQPPSTPYSDRLLEGYTDQLVANLTADVALDAAKWGIPSWGSSLSFSAAISQMKLSYFVPRRSHFYSTHNGSNGGVIPDSAVPARVKIRKIVGSPVSGDQEEEYLVLQNPNNDAVDISGWTLSGGIDFTFDPGTVIISGGVLYVSPNLVSFRARATGPSGGQELFVVGPYDANIGDGELLVLSNKDGRIVHQKRFTSFSAGND